MKRAPASATPGGHARPSAGVRMVSCGNHLGRPGVHAEIEGLARFRPGAGTRLPAPGVVNWAWAPSPTRGGRLSRSPPAIPSGAGRWFGGLVALRDTKPSAPAAVRSGDWFGTVLSPLRAKPHSSASTGAQRIGDGRSSEHYAASSATRKLRQECEEGGSPALLAGFPRLSRGKFAAAAAERVDVQSAPVEP